MSDQPMVLNSDQFTKRHPCGCRWRLVLHTPEVVQLTLRFCATHKHPGEMSERIAEFTNTLEPSSGS